MIVPLFALANAGIDLGGDVLGRLLGSPLAIGILAGLVAGKTLGIPAGAWLATRPFLGGLPLSVGWPSLIASSVAGIGFTMSLLIADLSYSVPLLEDAKLGVLAASMVAALLSIVMFYGPSLVPLDRLWRAEARTSLPIVDLAVPGDPEVDHIRGAADATVTLVEYGDYGCPHCGRRHPSCGSCWIGTRARCAS